MQSAAAFDLQLIRTFVTVADHVSFTAAADALNQTQSTISQQIKRLETRVGKPLFERSTRVVVLTYEGTILLDYSRSMLRISDEAYHKINAPELSGKLRIAACDDLTTYWLPQALKRFRRMHSNVRLEVHVGLTDPMVAMMQDQRLDLVLGKQMVGAAQGEVLATEQLVWAGDISTLKGVTDPIPLALFPDGCVYRRAATEALAQAERSWDVVCTSPSLAGLQAAVDAGIAITPMVDKFIDDMQVVGRHVLPDLPKVELALFTPINRKLSPQATLFCELLRQISMTPFNLVCSS